MGRLTGPEFKTWFRAFTDAFNKRADLDLVVQFVMNKGLPEVAGADLEDDIARLIRDADTGGYLKPLLQEAVARNPGSPQLVLLAKSFELSQMIEPDSPYDALQILGEAMIDRDDFRRKLAALQTDRAAPVLLVHGKRFTGKTWSARLITHVAKGDATVEAVYVDVEDLEGKPVGAAILGQRIAEIGEFADPPPPNEEMDAQWARQYCSWLGRRAKGRASAVWIVIDHLDKVLIEQGASDFLQEFGAQIPKVMPNVRLILLGYHEPASLQVGIGPMEVDPLDGVTNDKIKTSLLNFFGAELLSRQREKNVDPDLALLTPQAATATEAVLSTIQEGDPLRMFKLRDAIREQLAQVP